MDERKIGKIQDIGFGKCGYQNACIGIWFSLGSDKNGWGCGDDWSAWDFKPSEGAKWTEETRVRLLGEIVLRISKIMKDAKVEQLSDLKGKPVEVTFENNALKSWRILKEAI